MLTSGESKFGHAVSSAHEIKSSEELEDRDFEDVEIEKEGDSFEDIEIAKKEGEDDRNFDEVLEDIFEKEEVDAKKKEDPPANDFNKQPPPPGAPRKTATAPRKTGNSDPVDGLTEGLKNAFPMDRIARGGAAAKDFFSWGFGKVTEEARKVEKAVAESEFGRTIKTEVEKAKEKTEELSQAVRESEAVRRSREVSLNTLQRVELGVREVSEKVTHVFDDVGSAIDPALEEARRTSSEMADHVKPALNTAKEQTKHGLQTAASTAMKAAIWLQSLGSGGFDSDEEQNQSPTRGDSLGKKEEESGAPAQAGMQDEFPAQSSDQAGS